MAPVAKGNQLIRKDHSVVREVEWRHVNGQVCATRLKEVPGASQCTASSGTICHGDPIHGLNVADWVDWPSGAPHARTHTGRKASDGLKDLTETTDTAGDATARAQDRHETDSCAGYRGKVQDWQSVTCGPLALRAPRVSGAGEQAQIGQKRKHSGRNPAIVKATYLLWSNSSSEESSLMERFMGRIGVGTAMPELAPTTELASGVLLNSGMVPGVAGEWTSWEP